MNDISEIVARLKMAGNFSTDKEVAGIFKLTPQEFSIRKKRGTLLPLIVNHGINQKIDLNWLLSGESHHCIKEGKGAAVDLGLLGETIRVVEDWLERNQRRLPPEKKAEVVLYLYEEYLKKEEKPETATVERLLKLVA